MVKIWEIMESIMFGGPGSGHHGHSGRKGKRGGSAPSRGNMSPTVGGADKAAVGFLDRGDVDPMNTGGAGKVKDSIVQELADRTGLPYEDVNEVIKQWAHSANDEDYRSLSLQEAISEEFGIPLSPWQKERAEDLGSAWRVSEERDLIKEYVALDKEMKVTPFLSRYTPEYEGSRRQEIGDRMFELRNKARDLGITQQFTTVYQRSHVLSHRDDPRGDTRKIVRAMYNHTQEELSKAGIKDVVLFRGKEPGWKDTAGQPMRKGMDFKIVSNAASSWTAAPEIAVGFGDVITARVPAKRILGTARTGFGCLRELEYVVLGGGDDTVTLDYDRGVPW